MAINRAEQNWNSEDVHEIPSREVSRKAALIAKYGEMPARKFLAGEYCRSIRNIWKRAYAVNYWAFLLGLEKEAPREPAKLSYMAAQAVRMTLHNIAR